MRDLVTSRRRTRLMRRVLLALAGLGVAVLMAFPLRAGAAPDEQFSPAQRAEIVRILRDALKQDPTILRDALEALKDDDAHRETDAARVAIGAHRAGMVTPDDPMAGNPNGTVTIVEFFDTRCPYCRRMEPTMAQLLAQDHDVRLVFKDLPILGPESVLAAHALLAAQKQDGYEKLRTALMLAPPNYTKDGILAIARKLGLDDARLGRDMDDAVITARLNANLQLARELSLDGTPALVIGNTLVPGAVELAELEKTVATAREAR
jgi:protein-disulfide isomerase